jgi:hypothetical protein
MITVRFPSGFSIQYNDLDHADFRTDGAYLGEKKSPSTYSVWVPKDCVVEHIRPCRTYNAATESSENDTRAEVQLLQKKVAALTRSINKRQKAGVR